MTDNNTTLTSTIRKQLNDQVQNLFKYYGEDATKPNNEMIGLIHEVYTDLALNVVEFAKSHGQNPELNPIYLRLLESKMWFQNRSYTEHIQDSEYMPSLNRLFEAQMWFHTLGALAEGL